MSQALEPGGEGADHDRSFRLARLRRRIRVALGQEPGDLLLVGGQVVNVFTQSVEPANVVIADGWIAGVGPLEWEARERLDASGQCILPGLIDAHMHLESTLLTPAELARVVVPRGTATIIADPHEVANVLGTAGVEMLRRATRQLPLDVVFMAPSCVPASQWESAGARIDGTAVARLLDGGTCHGLAEVMDFPGVLSGSRDMLAKILAADERRAAIDGHAPGLGGRELVAYAAAGIRSDHESTTAGEALAKAALGMLVQVREGSAARNLDTLAPLAAAGRLGQWCLCTDDIYPNDLLRDGHIDGLLRRVVVHGVPAPLAVRHATLVPAMHYGLRDRGAVAPGYRADLVAVDDLKQFRARLVIHAGQVAACDGRLVADLEASAIDSTNTVHIGQLGPAGFQLPLGLGPCPVIVARDGQIVTGRTTYSPPGEGPWQFDPAVDVALAACIERHTGSGRVGLGLVSGFGLKHPGALASTVAHDGHNLLVVGTDADAMVRAAAELARIGGGWTVVSAAGAQATLPLPIAGLLSDRTAAEVADGIEQVTAAARRLGCRMHNPFGALSFLALSVIPELRVTDHGLLDVAAQRLVPY